MKYKVMSDSMGSYNGIEVDYVIDEFTIGRSLMFLGEHYTLQQNGKILVLANSDRVITIMDVTPEVVMEKSLLVINETIDIFLASKEIQVTAECTYFELFKFLKNEWLLVKELSGINFPFTYDKELKLLTFRDSWGFAGGNFSCLKEGTFSRVSADGRSI